MSDIESLNIKMGTLELGKVTNFNNAIVNDAVTGQYSEQIIQTLIRKIAPFSRTSTEFYIGISSGGRDGCRDRWNSKYKAMGYTNMICIYESKSKQILKWIQ